MINLGDNTTSFKLGSNDVQIYLGTTKLYPTDTGQTPCYDVIDYSIASYTGDSTDVYSTPADKWYKRNNLGGYEEYGIYGSGRNITYYQGKLTIDDGYEYIYSGNSWVNIGEVSGTSIDTIWLDPATENAEFAIGHYWGEGYRMVFNCYLSGSYSSDSGSFWRSQNQTPFEFSFYSNGYYLDGHYPTSTSSPSVYTGDYSWRIMKSSVFGNYENGQVMNITLMNGRLQAHLESTGALVTSASTNVTSQNWYNGLYQATITLTNPSIRKSHLSSIKVYNANDELVNNIYFVKNPNVTGSGELSLYDSAINVTYNNTNDVTPTYHIVSSGSVEYPMYYSEKQDPPQNLTFTSMTEALQYQCPYVGLIATIAGQLYIFNDQYQWEQLAYDITGVTKSSSDFTIKLNGVNETCTVYQDNGDGTYNWGMLYNGSVTSIAASGNTNLVSIDFGDVVTSGMTSLGTNAFSGCTSLVEFTIPSGVTSIGSGAFIKCSSLTSITIPSGVTQIQNNTFQDCGSLTSITMPNSINSFGSAVFYNCSSLTSVEIPSAVTSISPQIFYGCSSLTSITIPSSVTSIGDSAFIGCNGLTSITIPSSVTSVGKGAFRSCTSLPTITIPSGVTSIGASAFTSCSSLTSVTIPSGVTTIGNAMFYGCTSLPTITIPSGVTSIGASAFTTCTSLTSITIPSGVTTIGDAMFRYCSRLTSITIPNGVTSIGQFAFASCESLTNITIPSGVTSIVNDAFRSCSRLASITIPNGVTRIGDRAFRYCSRLTSITIPSGVTSIGQFAFEQCSRLTSITCLALTPPTLDSRVFDNTNNAPIYTPCISVDSYKAATSWTSYSSRIQSIPNCTTEWRTVSGEYGCVDGDKYALEAEYISYDGGTTWIETGNKRAGTLIETGSTDCQYVVPLDYDELEYIQSQRQTSPTGTSAFLIPFEMQPTNDCTIEFTPMYFGLNYYCNIMGGGTSETNSNFLLRGLDSGWGATNRRTHFAYYNYSLSTQNGNPLSYSLFDDVKCKLSVHLVNYAEGNGVALSVENYGYSPVNLTSTTVSSTAYTVTAGTFNIPLFSNMVSNNTFQNAAALKLHNLKCESNGTPRYDYRPVKRKSDNQLGLYDVVHQQFYYTNNLTFTAGPIKQ